LCQCVCLLYSFPLTFEAPIFDLNFLHAAAAAATDVYEHDVSHPSHVEQEAEVAAARLSATKRTSPGYHQLHQQECERQLAGYRLCEIPPYASRRLY